MQVLKVIEVIAMKNEIRTNDHREDTIEIPKFTEETTVNNSTIVTTESWLFTMYMNQCLPF